MLRKKNLFWKWELKTYFGLSFDQIKEMEESWNTFYGKAEAKILRHVPSGEHNVTNYAYWQWANGIAKRNKSSLVDIRETETGYPEFFYWLDQFCNPDHVGAMSSDNWSQFKDVKMYRDTGSDATNNLQSLFYLPELGVDPPASSIFNITTL